MPQLLSLWATTHHRLCAWIQKQPIPQGTYIVASDAVTLTNEEGR